MTGIVDAKLVAPLILCFLVLFGSSQVHAEPNLFMNHQIRSQNGVNRLPHSLLASHPDYGRGYRRYRHRGYYGGYRGAYDCHPVSKYRYDDYGYRIKIGGTMCYDDYGNPYVVPGSRFIIGRY